jgi:DNA-binding response OmpR family regulator
MAMNITPPDPVRILLVEDEPLISLVTAELLSDAGFLVEEAASATEAVAKLRDATSRFAAAIVDLGLPDRSGDVLAKEIHQLDADLPIVIASGRDRQEVARMFGDDARVGFVGKPYDAAALLDALCVLGVVNPPAE